MSKAKQRIDLFKQWEAFDMLCIEGKLPGITGNYKSVYFGLLSMNNSTFWSEEFDLDFDYTLRLTKVDKETYRRAMDFFNKNSLFDRYIKGVNKYARARVSLKVLYGKSTGNMVANQYSSEGGTFIGVVGDKPTGSVSSDEHFLKTSNLNNDINKTETYISFAHLSMSVDEFNELRALGYSKKDIDLKLNSIKNWKQNINYVSLFDTAKDWLQREKEKSCAQKEKEIGVSPGGLPKTSEDLKIDRALNAFETYKHRGYVTDWDNEVFDMLYGRKILQVNADVMTSMAKDGKLSQAKQIGLMEFFNSLAEEGMELKNLLNPETT